MGAASFNFQIYYTLLQMNEKKIEMTSSIQNLCEIDTLSIMSHNLQNKLKSSAQSEQLKDSAQSLKYHPSHNKIIHEQSKLESFQMPERENKELDMSFLVVEGLQIARRQSKRQNQLNRIFPKYKENVQILNQQLRQLLFHVQLGFLAEEERELKKKICHLQKLIADSKIESSRPAPKIVINPRRYVTTKNTIFPSKMEQKRIQEITMKIRKKKQQFLKNKLKMEQLCWEEEKLERRSRLRINDKNRPPNLRTVSKKQPEISENKVGFRRLRPSESSFKKIRTPQKDIKCYNPYFQYEPQHRKTDNSSKKQHIDKSQLKESDSVWTQQQTKKQYLIRRLKILKQSITLYEGTFSKIIAQIQLQCSLLTKQIECFEDGLTINNYMLEKSDICKTHNLQNNTLSNVCKTREKHSKSISPPPSSKSRLVKCNSQNLRRLVLSKQRKLSSYLKGKSKESLLTCKKIRIKSAHDDQSKSKCSSRLKDYSSPNTIKQTIQKKQELIMQQYFQKENKTSRKAESNFKIRYSPKLTKQFF